MYFIESGLTSGTYWSVTMTAGGVPSTKSSSSSEILFYAAENTKYSYTVSTVFGTVPSPSSGTLNIGTQGWTVDVTYSPAYKVTFAQNSSSALPTETEWTAKLGSSSYSTTGTSIAVGVSDGTFSYSIGRLSQYSPIPASGSVMVNGNSMQIEVYFINNTTTISSIKKLVNYFDPNWNYSSINLASFTYTANNVTHYYNDSAKGTAVLNNTGYSFTFMQAELNSTRISRMYSTVDMVNTTRVSQNSTSSDQTWTNTTTLNGTYNSVSDCISQSLAESKGNDYANKSLEIQYYNSSDSPSTATSYYNSSKEYISNTTRTTLGAGDANLNINVSTPTAAIGGNFTVQDPNGSINLSNVTLSGYVMNGSSRMGYSLFVENGEGILYLNGDPTNFTIDPQSFSESSWWGWAWLYVGYFYYFQPIPSWEIWILSLITGFTVTAAVAALTDGLGFLMVTSSSFIAGTLTSEITQADGVYFNAHENSNGYWIEYASAAASLTWWGDVGLYGEVGMYSNQHYSNGQWQGTPWEYYPMINLYSLSAAIWLESPHQSIWPSYPYSPPWP